MMTSLRSFFVGMTVAIALALAWPGDAAAAERIGATQIRALAQDWMEAQRPQLLAPWGENVQMSYRVAPLDNRLALAACAAPPRIEQRARGAHGRINLQISCEGPARWTLYIPVDLTVLRPVVVATRPVPRGQPVSAADLILKEVDVARLAGEYYTEIEQVAGMEARRPLAPDTVVLATSLDAPLMIRRGESVTVVLERDGLVVRSSARAETDGRRGQRIPVRNPGSQRVVDAWVTAPGEVAIRRNQDA